MMPASPMVGGGFTPPILDIVGSAAVAYSSARRLSSSNTSPFIAGAANVTSIVTPWDKLWSSRYLSNGDIDISQLTSEIGVLNSAGIQTWNDQSGNGRNATRGGTAVARHPIFYATVSGGFQYLNAKLTAAFLDSDTRFMSFNAITLASEFSIFVVDDRASTSTFGALIGATETSPTNLNVGLGVWSDGNIYALDSSGYLQVANTNTSARVLEFTRTGGTRQVLENGTLLSGTTVTQTRNNVISQIGRLDSAGLIRYTTGRISEVIIYNRALSTNERNTVTANLREYYGV